LQKLDPGAAVALGAPLQVRMFVPLWVVNATPLPVAALVVPMQQPPQPSERDARAGQELMDVAEAIKLKVLETGAASRWWPPSSQWHVKRYSMGSKAPSSLPRYSLRAKACVYPLGHAWKHHVWELAHQPVARICSQGEDSDVLLDRDMPQGARHVLAGSVSMVAYPMQQLAALKRSSSSQSYGLRLKVKL
jgi:hypothetical protein